MPINFPGSPKHDQVWPVKGDTINLSETKGVIFQYDQYTNSWDIVGPDNIATTDWVLGQKKDDTTMLERAYDLVTATNDIGIECGYNTKLFINCQSVLDSGLRGEVLLDGNDYEDTLDTYIPDFASCVVSAGLGAGSLGFAGIDPDKLLPENNDGTLTSINNAYRFLETLVINKTDRFGDVYDWMNDVTIGDTLEMSYEGSTGNAEYVIYTISDVAPSTNNNTVYIRLNYVGSSHPDDEIRITGANTYYLLRTYKRSVTTEGATFDGPVRVRVDDEEALSARPKTGAYADMRTFFVDTNSMVVSTNIKFSTSLGSQGYDAPELVATYGYVNMRLGADENGNRGPFLPLAGGTMTNDFGLIIKRQPGMNSDGGRTLTIRGKLTSSGSSNSDLLHVKEDGGADYVAYHATKYSNSDAILNREQIEVLIAGAGDTTPYLPIGGGTMTGKILGISLSPSNDDEAASKKYADTKEYVHNGSTNEAGRIWTNGNSLFFNPYP